ncbi:hypothetical protein ACWGPQ_22055 [Saccharomonospora azurea]|jgi:hypothetical protein
MSGRRAGWPAFELVLRINTALIKITVSSKALPWILLGPPAYFVTTGIVPGV